MFWGVVIVSNFVMRISGLCINSGKSELSNANQYFTYF